MYDRVYSGHFYVKVLSLHEPAGANLSFKAGKKALALRHGHLEA